LNLSNRHDLRLASSESLKLGRHNLGSNVLLIVGRLFLQDLVFEVGHLGGGFNTSLEAVVEEGVELEVNGSGGFDSTGLRVDLNVEGSEVSLSLINLEEESVVLNGDPLGCGLSINSHGVNGVSTASNWEGIESESNSGSCALVVVGDVLNVLTCSVLVIADQLAVNNDCNISDDRLSSGLTNCSRNHEFNHSSGEASVSSINGNFSSVEGDTVRGFDKSVLSESTNLGPRNTGLVFHEFARNLESKFLGSRDGLGSDNLCNLGGSTVGENLNHNGFLGWLSVLFGHDVNGNLVSSDIFDEIGNLSSDLSGLHVNLEESINIDFDSTGSGDTGHLEFLFAEVHVVVGVILFEDRERLRLIGLNGLVGRDEGASGLGSLGDGEAHLLGLNRLISASNRSADKDVVLAGLGILSRRDGDNSRLIVKFDEGSVRSHDNLEDFVLAVLVVISDLCLSDHDDSSLVSVFLSSRISNEWESDAGKVAAGLGFTFNFNVNLNGFNRLSILGFLGDGARRLGAISISLGSNAHVTGADLDFSVVSFRNADHGEGISVALSERKDGLTIGNDSLHADVVVLLFAFSLVPFSFLLSGDDGTVTSGFSSDVVSEVGLGSGLVSDPPVLFKTFKFSDDLFVLSLVVDAGNVSSPLLAISDSFGESLLNSSEGEHVLLISTELEDINVLGFSSLHLNGGGRSLESALDNGLSDRASGSSTRVHVATSLDVHRFGRYELASSLLLGGERFTVDLGACRSGGSRASVVLEASSGSITIAIGEAFASLGTFTELVNDLSAVNWGKHSDDSFCGLEITVGREVLELTLGNDGLSLDRSLSGGESGLGIELEADGFTFGLGSGHILGELGGVGHEMHGESGKLGSLLVIISSEVDINVLGDLADLSVFALHGVSLVDGSVSLNSEFLERSERSGLLVPFVLASGVLESLESFGVLNDSSLGGHSLQVDDSLCGVLGDLAAVNLGSSESTAINSFLVFNTSHLELVSGTFSHVLNFISL
jgi:hypothetical protein